MTSSTATVQAIAARSPKQRGRGTERIAGNIPQRVKQGRPHPPLAQQRLEPGEVALLGLGHLPDHPGGAAAAEHVQLPFIDAGRAVLAGVIDAQHARDLLVGRTVARQSVSHVCSLMPFLGATRPAPRPCAIAETRRGSSPS